jgi:hypothetical protein
MTIKAIISFYKTKKGASTWLTPLVVGLIKLLPFSESLRSV